MGSYNLGLSLND